MTITLYPFQRTCVDFHKAHHYSLNGCEMGIGKSIIALTTARELGFAPLVIGPAFLKKTWEDEGVKVGVPVRFVAYSMLHHLDSVSARKYNLWVCDEVHNLKNPTAKRTHAFYTLLKDCVPEYFIGLSGTPLKNKCFDLWTLLAFCGMNPKGTSGQLLTGELKKYHAFSRYFCNVVEMKINGRRIPKYTTVREDKIPELKNLLRNKMIRFRVEDVLDDLPSLTRIPIPLDLGSTYDRELQDTFDAYILGHKANSTAKRQSALLKAQGTLEYCKELMEGGSGPLVIFTDHVESAKFLQGVHPKAKVITGGTPMAERQDAVTDFQSGAIPVIVATIGSMSVGVTLTAARHVVFNDMSWVPADNLQAEKRIHRIGQKGACFSHYIESTPTDKHIRKTLFSKMDTINKVID